MEKGCELNGKNALSTRDLVVEPYLNLYSNRIYNPVLDRHLFPKDTGYSTVKSLIQGKSNIARIDSNLLKILIDEGWLVQDSNGGLAERFYLKFVSLEAHTVCNQACYFCPVSAKPRKDYSMPDELYEDILRQLSKYSDTISLVYMINYNEPTIDKRFVDQVRTIKKYGLPPAVNTNATGLTPQKVDKIMEMGGLARLEVNMSSLDRVRYSKDRAADHIEIVKKNMNYMKDKKIAEMMDISVLGQGDKQHMKDFIDISEYFRDSYFSVKYHIIMDRAGHLYVGRKPVFENKSLCGCDNLGSRPLQHIHITPHGKCVLCCEDYDEDYVVGDLTTQTVEEVLKGPEIKKLRKWVYGVEKAPENFICSKCVFSMPERDSFKPRSLLSKMADKLPSLINTGANA